MQQHNFNRYRCAAIVFFHTKEFLIVTKARYGIHYVRSSAIESIQADEQTTI